MSKVKLSTVRCDDYSCKIHCTLGDSVNPAGITHTRYHCEAVVKHYLPTGKTVRRYECTVLRSGGQLPEASEIMRLCRL